MSRDLTTFGRNKEWMHCMPANTHLLKTRFFVGPIFKWQSWPKSRARRICDTFAPPSLSENGRPSFSFVFINLLLSYIEKFGNGSVKRLGGKNIAPKHMIMTYVASSTAIMKCIGWPTAEIWYFPQKARSIGIQYTFTECSSPLRYGP